ncbi:adhesin [Vibrio cholerae]|uniref:MARTX multifunctional-autoprocessing repeats-in-toxin holotoxin RtxA n=3 Tax=Vibrio cholerae TaxID=666 RepID=UPI000BA9939B|nr:MARTX multifunctional-autoprocessing repeats-in-toxin holotoxin RtxA [Vibrio cholerae]PAS40418.1 adhesin [Vibrio cholerae]
MGKPFWRSVEYFFTGNYSADDGNNNIVAIGFGGQIHAYGGDDHVTVGSIGATVYTGSGNDTVVGGSAYLKVEDSTGHLTVKGAAGYADINKSGDGNVSFAGAAGGVSIDHLGNHGDVSYGGAAAYNGITRKGLSGNVTFAGAGGYNALWHETNQGNLSFTGAGAGNKLDRTWFNRYQGSHGDVTFDGAGAANSISSRVETGNITFRGAGADNHLVRKGKVGDITLQGAGASNRIERTHQAEDVYTQTRGNIRFEGVGGYNSLYSDVAHGDIHFSGGGAYNTIIRKGSGNDFAKEGMTNAKADEIVLTKAVMSGSWIGQDHHVTAVKSASEPNTYLFAFADSTYTKINKVQLRNDPQTGELKYYSTAWYKEGNHLSNLANQDISDNGGFTAVNINGAYTLSDLKVEHQQSVTVHAVEKSLTEYEWVTYANGAVIDAKEVSLSDAKMGGHAIYADGTKVDVKAVKSNRQPNTYIYAKVLGPYTKIVVVELANDPETGALKYQARSWYKEGDYTANIANQDISSATGYNPMGKGGYSLSDLHYSVNAVRSTSETVADIEEYTDQTLFKPANDSGESSGDVRFNGAGGGNVIKSNVTRGNVHFNGGGIANVILHSSQFGNTEFNGGGAANVIVKSGEEGDLTFRGAGLANVLVHQSQQGKMDVYAGGAVNVLVRLGDGQYLAHLLAYGNISVQKGSGDSRVVMLGGYNTHTQIGSGNGLWLAAGGFNVMTQVGQGDVAAVLAGVANVLTKMGEGELTSGLLGGANVITHISNDDQLSNTTAVALGGANILTKKGKGNTLAVMGGGANVLTHVGDGTTTGVMVGGANILTKVGNGDTTGIMLGVGNVLTHVGDGQTLGVMGAAGNIFTKVGDGASIAVMIGAGNIFTHVGEGNAWALMGGLGNVFTKVGNGDALALMVAEANVFTHIGDGMSVALMLAKGNVATKVGNGTTLAAMVGNANIFTHIGHDSTFAAMIGQANIMTKVGNDLTAALMVGKANIMTHVGDGTSLGLFAGEVNVMTKVGNGTTLAAMFGKANIMTHVGDGLTGVLALGEANIVTKVGDDFMGVVAAAKANVVTHVGDATTAAVLAGKGNILTKVGEGTTVGLLISDVGNVMTHVGDGTTIGIAKGKANLITKVGDGLGVNVTWGQANVFTQVGDGDRYNFAKGEANLITKVGDGQEVSVVQGEANIITHVGNGDDYTGAWGKANVITKVGHGQNVVLAKGEANIVTQVGDGDSFNALWSKGNIVTKVGDGMQVTAAKGQANITTTVGNGLNVTAAYGDANINTKVGDGVSVNVAWGKYNINTKVGDGLNVAVMKGKANANIHVGDGLNINASYAQNNVAIKVGNGDFYSLAVASSNTSSNKLSALFDNIKQTVLGVGGSQAINYLVQGDEASSSGTHKGRGAIATPEITKLDGFQMDAIKEVSSDLGDSLTGSVTKVDTPDLNKMQHALNVDDSSVQAPNLIVNGDFELGEHGWQSTHGVEASYAGSVYGVEGEGHGARVTELDTYTNTSLYQDLANLAQGEVIAVSFDFAKRAGLSNNEGIEVLWNGEVVFSSSGDESAWQQKTLKLTAQAGSNRIEFKGTGHNDGLGYILDNVVATSESLQQANAIREHATQNPATQNALSDKERAEADRQRLEQEKQKQLDAVAGSQSQLVSTDQQALGNNGQAQRDAVQEESEAITAELTKLAQGLDVLDSQATHTGESGDQWRNEFASGLLAGVQTQLDDAKQLANDKITEAKQTHADNQNKVKDAVAKSEVGVAKGEQNRAGAEQDIADAQADAEKRKADALAKGKDAQQAESDAHHAVNNAQSRGDRDVQVAENKANQAQADAQGAKQNEGDRPDRQGVTGSGLSGQAYQVEGAGETESHINTDAQVNADGRFSQGLTEQEQEALEGATNAVNRLQINAGIRAKNSRTPILSMFTQSNNGLDKKSVTSQEVFAKDINRNEVELSGVGLADIENRPVRNRANPLILLQESYFNWKAGKNSIKEASFHFHQGIDLLDAMKHVIPEISHVLITHGNSVQAKSFLDGVCFGLAARYLMEERVHGLGGGEQYLNWLKDSVKAYNSKTEEGQDFDSVRKNLLNHYRRQNLGTAIETILSMQHSQDVLSPIKANAAYGGRLKAAGLAGKNIDTALMHESMGYEAYMDSLQNVDESTYLTFMSEDHAMSVVVHKNGDETTWSFYDPNLGTKTYQDYESFRSFMDSFHNRIIQNYKFEPSKDKSQSFNVHFNRFVAGKITDYDNVWKQSRDNEQAYLLKALEEQGKSFKLKDGLTAKLIDYQDDILNIEVQTKLGKTLNIEMTGNNLGHAVELIQSRAEMINQQESGSKLYLSSEGSVHKTKIVDHLSQLFTKQELKESAKAFAEPIGTSYQGILDQLDLVHQTAGRDQIVASFELNKKVNAYIAEHPTSRRNQALTQLKEQITSALLNNETELKIESRPKNYQSRDLVLEPIVQPETIELGMPDIDQKILAEVAERENVIIGVRPVDEKSKSLIDSKLYSSKGLFVKAKSSDWGPMSGFIPVDQVFAKASARRDLDKFNGYAEQSIESGNAVSADLYLNQVRIDELVSKYQSLTALEFDAESGMYKTTATNGDQTATFFLNKVTVDSKDLWQVHYMKDGELAPFKVIGDPVSKQPMTADYDLLTVMYSYADLGPQDKVKQPLNWEQWKESVTYEDLTPKYKELYNSEVLYNKKDGASLGVVSDRLKALKDVINTSLGRTDGLEMVHHGADDANPYAVMADNFPATFFVPKSFFMEDGLGEGKGSIQTYFNVNEQGAVVIRDPHEFSNFQQVAINVSYRASLNDKWNVGLDDPLFTPKRKLSHDFLNAKEEVIKKLSGEVETNVRTTQLLTDNEGLGNEGEKLRTKPTASGFFESSDVQPEVIKGLLQNVGDKIFDLKAGGKELDMSSFHFSQSADLLNKLITLIPEVGNVLITNGNDVQSKDFLEGVCFALSARYMMEERVHGLGGGKAYMEWLKDTVQAYNDNITNKKNDIGSVEQKLLNQYRRQNLGLAIKDLLSMQYSQLMDTSTSAARDAANKEYSGKLRANGLTGPNINDALNYGADGYESVMDKLRNVNKSTYMTFMSQGHAMSVVVHKKGNHKVWSFYDPNFGTKSFAQYDDFRGFMDNFHKGLLTQYKFQDSEEAGQSFYVRFNKFEEGDISSYDGLWKNAREGEQSYVLRALKEQGKTFSMGKNITGKLVDFNDDVITLDVTFKKGRKVLVEVPVSDISQAANLVQTNISQVFSDPLASKLSIQSHAESATITVLEVSGQEAISEVVEGAKTPGQKDAWPGATSKANNQNVNDWERVVVTPAVDGGETRFDGQIIVQMENDDFVAQSAANLAGKHPESSVVVQLDSDGNYRVVYGDPSKLDGKLRWQLVGHGRDHSESNNTHLSGYSADELAVKLASFQQMFNQAEKISSKPDHISIVGCSLVSDDKQKGFGHQFINAMDANGLRVDVSVRSSELAEDEAGRKHTKDANGDWVQKAENNKVSLSWDEQGEVVAKDERIRNGIAEGDIDLSRIGVSDVDEPARGAIGDNNDVFDAPEKRKPETEVIANSSSSNQLSYSGNIQVNVGEGEFTAVNWGTSNVGIKVGTGGFKSLAFGDNNVMVHIGDGESKHSVDIGGYQALEGAQMFLGNRNVSFNFGHSNDLILMMDKSIPTPPLVNPFDGAARISGVLQSIATSGEGEDWLAAQEQQWTLSGAKKFVKDMSGLDQSSSVDYTHLVQLNSQNERDSRGLKHDAEATLNKQYNQWLSGNGNSGTSQLSRADKLRQANEKLAFNFAVGGQGADIQVTTGNWNFMFGDNIQSILDTNLGSLFGLMTQQFTTTGQAKTTFTYTPQDLPRQLKNKLLGQLAGVGAETTLADIFGVDYTASGQIVSRNGQAVDGVAILKEMLEVIGEFSGDQLQAFVDPAKLLDSLKAGIDMGADGIKSFAETHGLKEKAPEEEKDNSSVSVNGANVNSAQGATVADGNTETAETQDRAFGFNSLNLPNLFATIFSQDKQKEMKSLVENLKQNLTADLLNMKEKTFDFLRNSGHLQGDGDINISLGNYNFNWGGDGKDLGAYLGDNNNFWGGRGDDVFYATGTSNIFTGGEGNDMGVLMGRENMMFGGDGNDTAVVAGRINHVFLGAGDDQSFVFGEGGEIDTGSGRDYVVTSGNFNRVDTGDDQDYSVTIGNNNQVELGAGNDFANVFGNYNRINAGAGNDVVKLMGYHAVLNGADGDDHLIATAISKFSQFNGGEGRDLMVLGGYQNTFKGGTDVDSFVVSGDVIDNLVEDIRSEDNIVFNGIDWQKLWFERSGYDLKLSILRDPSNDSDQSKFEHIGSVTFSDYFNGNRAQVVIGMSEKDLSGEREYTMLSDSAIDALVQAMSGFEPQAGDNGFIDSLESKSQAAISMAWSDVVHKKGLMV